TNATGAASSAECGGHSTDTHVSAGVIDKFTRAVASWTALFVGLLVLIVLLIFITQNTDTAQFAFPGWRWSLPLGLAILLAAVCGGQITGLAGTVRMFQLRRTAKKNLQALSSRP